MNEPLQLGRYTLIAELASGGMATVYLGRLAGDEGFGRTVAIKRLHRHLAAEPEFVAMFLDEARLAVRVQHPNVVSTLDVVSQGGELFVVMEYVAGDSLGALLKATRDAGGTLPIPIVTSVVVGFLHGLSAAHGATSERGEPLAIIHRDVSPQNVLVGVDGVARIVDFGIAKASTRIQTTREGQLKGKLAYMAPEQTAGEVSRQTDIYAAGVVLWEALTCRRLFLGETEAQLLRKVMEADVKEPSRHNAEVSADLDRVVLRALAREPEMRFSTAHEMAAALDAAVRPASPMVVGEWVKATGGEVLARRMKLIADLESNAAPAAGPHLAGMAESDDVHETAVTLPRLIPPPETGAAETTAPRRTRSSPGVPPVVPIALTLGALLLLGVSYVAVVRVGGTLPSGRAASEPDAGAPVVSAPTPSPEPSPSMVPLPPPPSASTPPVEASVSTRKPARTPPRGSPKAGGPLDVFSGPRK
jgi:eukaryotic-like serine/threonine-protein kinase